MHVDQIPYLSVGAQALRPYNDELLSTYTGEG